MGPTSQNPAKVMKSDNPFNYESNHTSFTQIRLRIDTEISKFRFYEISKLFQISISKH